MFSDARLDVQESVFRYVSLYFFDVQRYASRAIACARFRRGVGQRSAGFLCFLISANLSCASSLLLSKTTHKVSSESRLKGEFRHQGNARSIAAVGDSGNDGERVNFNDVAGSSTDGSVSEML